MKNIDILETKNSNNEPEPEDVQTPDDMLTSERLGLGGIG
jgi:hypothetical protein